MDFYRTRLTHSLEVAQIGQGIARQLRRDLGEHAWSQYVPDDTLIASICLMHDLGHPPFGHGGELALNYCMRDLGGFEGNGQTLRILSRLENASAKAGADVTRRTLLGVLKYPISFSTAHNPRLRPKLAETSATFLLDRTSATPPKCYLDEEQEVVDWLLIGLSRSDRSLFVESEYPKGEHRRSLYKSFDCSIMDLADDISYGVHDFEDAVKLKLVTEDVFRAAVPDTSCASFLDALKSKYPSESENNVYDVLVKKLFGPGAERKHQIHRLVGHLVTNVEVEELEGFEEPLLKYRVKLKGPCKPLLSALKKLVYDKVIKSANVQHLEFKGQQFVLAVFEALMTDPRALLPGHVFEKYAAEGEDRRVICDHVSGMTDHYLLRTYERLFCPRMGSVFDML